jgi:hypothetical protein
VLGSCVGVILLLLAVIFWRRHHKTDKEKPDEFDMKNSPTNYNQGYEAEEGKNPLYSDGSYIREDMKTQATE